MLGLSISAALELGVMVRSVGLMEHSEREHVLVWRPEDPIQVDGPWKCDVEIRALSTLRILLGPRNQCVRALLQISLALG